MSGKTMSFSACTATEFTISSTSFLGVLGRLPLASNTDVFLVPAQTKECILLGQLHPREYNERRVSKFTFGGMEMTC